MKREKWLPPVVRLAPRSNFDSVSLMGSRLAMMMVGIVALVAALDYGEVILSPLFLGVVVGLMFGPVADRFERIGCPPWISGGIVVILLVLLLSAAVTGFAMPLSDWMGKLPHAWTALQPHIASWKSVFETMSELQQTLRTVMGQNSAIAVSVDDGAAMKSVAIAAPEIVAELVIFLASLYFFIATRHRFRIAVLSLCFSRRMRWRAARMFRDVEYLVSRYLLSITGVNIGMGAAVAIAFWLAGIPSPLLWGMLAGVLNYVIYLGPAVMVFVMLGVGAMTVPNGGGLFTPAVIYLSLHLLEAQLVTPHVLGFTMTLNPFMIFLSLAFWIWIWGPIGGFIAVPSLLILFVIIRNILPAPQE